MQAINEEITEVEKILNGFRKELSEQRKLLKHAEAVKKALEGFGERYEYISKNLPQHLPGNYSRLVLLFSFWEFMILVKHDELF